jgi:bifunctional ADP-heptose synthase (sugar kinase/adenylyltransferase)
VEFEEDTPIRALSALRPDIWVKGGDYKPDDLPESSAVRGWDGQVVVVPYLAGRSTTRIVEEAFHASNG